uniref:Uncharacterized LOC107683391 n=1 Tax=Sinocyclocheilus anshuiensis TaxID=1608454 RepID=A0A671KEB5_9TELE
VALGDARMLEETSLKASYHGNTRVGPRGSDEDREEKQTCVDMNPQSGLYLQSSETCFPTRSSQLHDDLNELSDEWSSIGDLSQDASFSLEGCVKLEKRWMLWYEFKKELSCLDDWLRSAEKIAASPNSSHVLYVTAKEELQKYENLRAEARIRLTQLDGLTKLCQTLVGLFRGAMGARLVEMTKDCGQRWDQLSNTVETVCRRLKVYKDPQRTGLCVLLTLAVRLRVCWRMSAWRLSLRPVFLSPVKITWFWSGTLQWTLVVQSPMMTRTRPPSVQLQVCFAQVNQPNIL